MSEDVHQHDAGTLHRREGHECREAGGGIDPGIGAAARVGEAGEIGLRAPRRLALAVPQGIQRRVMRDAEQPALGPLMVPAEGSAWAAFASASWTTSSPSKAEPSMRAQ